MGEGPWGSGGRLPAPPSPLPSLVSVPLALTFSSSAHFLLPDYFFSLLSQSRPPGFLSLPSPASAPSSSVSVSRLFLLSQTRRHHAPSPAPPPASPRAPALCLTHPAELETECSPPSRLPQPMWPPHTTCLPPNAPPRRTPPGATPGSVPFISFPAGSCAPGIPLPGHPRSFPLSTPNPPRVKKSPPAGAEVAKEPGQAGQRK